MKVRCWPTLARIAPNVIASALLLSRLSWATQASCGTTMALSNIGTGTGNGCYTVDQTYSNFAVTNLGSPSAPVQSTSTVAIAGSSTWASDATPWINTETLSGNTAADSNTAAPWTVTGIDQLLQASILFITNSTESYFSPSGYPTPPSGESLLITKLSLSALAQTGLDANDYVTVTIDFCIGAAACTTSSSTGNMMFLQEGFYGSNVTTANSFSCGYYSTSANAGATCSSFYSSTSPITVTFNNPVPTLNVTANYALTTWSATTTDTLTSFSINYGNEEVAPEPSTFALLGAALAIIGVFERTKRKRDCQKVMRDIGQTT